MTLVFNKKSETLKRKTLRANLPKPEIILWKRIKNKQLGGYKFRRQYSVGRYVVDFYCPIAKLAIELDGDSHYVADAPEYDKIRENFIKEYGIRFLRFKNSDIQNNLIQVLENILSACKEYEKKF